MLTLAERFAYARKKAGLTPAQLSRALKITPSAVSQIEKGGTQSLRAPTALAMERVTGVAADWLMDGRGNPAGNPMPGGADDQCRRIAEMIEQLPPALRDKAEADVRFLLALHKKD